MTRGEAGALITVDGKEYEIPPAKPEKVVDPTGARRRLPRGFVAGMSRGFSWPVVGRMAALTAVYAIEHPGTQEHAYSLDEFLARYEANYGSPTRSSRSRRMLDPSGRLLGAVLISILHNQGPQSRGNTPPRLTLTLCRFRFVRFVRFVVTSVLTRAQTGAGTTNQANPKNGGHVEESGNSSHRERIAGSRM